MVSVDETVLRSTVSGNVLMVPTLRISTIKWRSVLQNNFLVCLSGFNETREDYIKQKTVPMVGITLCYVLEGMQLRTKGPFS